MTRWEQIKKGLRTFLSTGEEWHAFVIGFFEILCPWKPRYYIITQETADTIGNEYHYYLAGRGAGFVTLILIVIALCKLGKESLL